MGKLKSEVSIGVLKNKLSAYLQKVKTGNELIVTDHNHPVARIIPIDSHTGELVVVMAKKPPGIIMELIKGSPVKDYRSLDGLRKDRGER